MKRSLRMNLARLGMLLCICTAWFSKAAAQTDADAIMIPKNMFCGELSYDHGNWNQYWEGTLKRNNLNIGTVTTNSYMAMGNYGITNKLDLLFSVPYITTNAS